MREEQGSNYREEIHQPTSPLRSRISSPPNAEKPPTAVSSRPGRLYSEPLIKAVDEDTLPTRQPEERRPSQSQSTSYQPRGALFSRTVATARHTELGSESSTVSLRPQRAAVPTSQGGQLRGRGALFAKTQDITPPVRQAPPAPAPPVPKEQPRVSAAASVERRSQQTPTPVPAPKRQSASPVSPLERRSQQTPTATSVPISTASPVSPSERRSQQRAEAFAAKPPESQTPPVRREQHPFPQTPVPAVPPSQPMLTREAAIPSTARKKRLRKSTAPTVEHESSILQIPTTFSPVIPAPQGIINPNSSEFVIQMSYIVKKFYVGLPNELTILKGISLNVRKGEFISIVGASGSGKSTLMNIIGALDHPTAGEYYLGGEDIRFMNANKLSDIRNRRIGFVFQTFNLIPRTSALKNVELPMLYGGVPRGERVRRAKALMEMVDMGDRAKHLPNELSGGQKQRVAIARAMANNPDIILADEPTGALDTQTGRMVMDVFHKLNKEQGKTIVLITHNPELAQETGRVLTISDGQIISEKINSDPRRREAGHVSV